MSTIGPMAVAHTLVRLLFDEVDQELLTEPAAERILRYTLYDLIAMDGWHNTAAYDLILKVWELHPWVTGAFAFHEIYLPCGQEEMVDTGVDGIGHTPVTCSRPKGHIIDHWDEDENLEWPVS